MVTPEVRLSMFPDFPGNSRIWIFQSKNPIEEASIQHMEERISSFLNTWKAHGQPVNASAKVFWGHFLVIVADETHTHVSGCAGDALHKMVHEVEAVTGSSFFDRLSIPIFFQDKLFFYTRKALQQRIADGELPEDVEVFDHTVSNLDAWRNSWVVSYKSSWLARNPGQPSISH